MSISEYLVTGYHSSRKPLHEYCAQCPLLIECRESGNDSVALLLQKYLDEYERTVAEPLPKRSDTISFAANSEESEDDDSEDDDREESEDEKLGAQNYTDTGHHRYNDDVNPVLWYITEINGALHRILLPKAFPLQIDVFFVAPRCHTQYVCY